MNETIRGAAFFDLDRTLIDVNSAVLFAQYERRAGRISMLRFLCVIGNSLLYHYNLLDLERAYEHALKHYRGVDESLIEERTSHFFEDKIRARLQPGAKRALAHHRERGHPLVMLTTSTSFQAKIATATWGLDDWLASRLIIDAGKLSGSVQRPLCYGPGKVALARQWAEPRNIDLSQSYFYSDSYSDLPMLEEVGFPVVVNPDPKLRVHATRKGWPVVDWSGE